MYAQRQQLGEGTFWHEDKYSNFEQMGPSRLSLHMSKFLFTEG